MTFKQTQVQYLLSNTFIHFCMIFICTFSFLSCPNVIVA